MIRGGGGGDPHTRQSVLADVLGRVLAKANRVSNGAALESLLEAEIETLVRARGVIRALPIRETSGYQSVYFSIPSVAAPPNTACTPSSTRATSRPAPSSVY